MPRHHVLPMIVLALVISHTTAAASSLRVAPQADRSTFQAYLPDNPKGLDPAMISDVLSIKVGSQLYQGMVSVDDRGQLGPALAESWSTTDGRKWAFRLRRDARFCDDPAFTGGRGRTVTASDVKFSLQRVVQKAQGSPGSWLFLGLVDGAHEYHDGKRAAVDGFVVRDPQTFEIQLREAHFPFVHRLATNYAWVVAPEAVQRYGSEFAIHPVGAGEFCFRSRRLDEEVILVRKDGRGAGITTLRFRVIKDPVLALQQFRQGALSEYDVAVEQLPQILAGGSLKPEYRGVQWISLPGLNWYFVGINMTDPILGGSSEKSRLLRQALQRAINTELLAQRVLFGGAEPLRRVFLPIEGPPNPNIADIRFNRQAAVDLLARAGHPGGRGAPSVHFVILNTDEARAVAAQIQADWAAIGIRSDYEQRDFPTLVDLVLKGKSPVTLLFIDAISLSPDYVVQFFLPDAPFNFFRYKNPQLGRSYARSLRTADGAERDRIYAEMENAVLADAPWLLLYARRKMILLQAGVHGYRLNALRQVDYAGVSLD